MLRALAGRFVFALALVMLAFCGAYLLTALAPGDAVAMGDGMASTRTIEAERARLGLEQPVWSRLGMRLGRLARLDLGRSVRFNRPVLPLVAERMVATVQAGGAALVLALAIGIPAGVLASQVRNQVVAHAVAATSIVLLSVPALVIALVLSLAATRLSPFAIMAVSLALPAAALFERLQARAMTAALGETCLHAARARGVPARAITWRHAWPLSLPSVLGVAGIVASHLLSGALAIELVTARGGLGRLTFEALMARDLDLAAACAGAAALLVGLATFAADTLQMWLDPRLLIETGAFRGRAVLAAATDGPGDS